MVDKVDIDLGFLEGLIKITNSCPESHCRNDLLLLAIEKNVEYLVDALLPLVKDNLQFYRAAILSAVLSNRPQMVEKLLNDSLTVNTAWNEFGETALHSAAELGFDKIVAFLIEKGADVNVRDKKGMTPLHFAKSAAVVEALLNGGADINAVDVLGNTPMRVAIDYLGDDFEEFTRTIQDEVVEALLLGGAKPEPYYRVYPKRSYHDEDYREFTNTLQEMEHDGAGNIAESSFKAYTKDSVSLWGEPHPGRLVSEHIIKCNIANVPTLDIKPCQAYDTEILRTICEVEVTSLATIKFGTVSLLDIIQGIFQFQDLSVVPDGVLKAYLESENFKKQFPIYSRLVQKSFDRFEKKVEKLLAWRNIQTVMNKSLDRSAKRKLLCALPVNALSTPPVLKRAKHTML